MKVLVGVDESAYSNAAIRFISEGTWPKGSRFIVLSSSPSIFLGAGDTIPPDSLAQVLRQEESRHREIADRAAAGLRNRGLSVDARVERGDARTVLVDAARSEEADLVIVGSHGRTGLKRLLLGSVASYVVAHAPCSVLVVKEPQMQDRTMAVRESGHDSKEAGAVKVERLMTRDVETCAPDMDVAHAAMIMARRNCGLVPVVEHGSGRLAGVITDRDICIAAAMRHADAHSIPVGEVMTRRLTTCSPTDEIRVAMRRMSEARVRRLPVVDRLGVLKGVVSLTDLALVAGRPLESGERGIQEADVVAVLNAVSASPVPAVSVTAA
jgi:CBS domain-containing protein/nucleotide-binding universal stress UspA family protein